VETVDASTKIKTKSRAILTDFNVILKITDKRQSQQTLFYQ